MPNEVNDKVNDGVNVHGSEDTIGLTGEEYDRIGFDFEQNRMYPQAIEAYKRAIRLGKNNYYAKESGLELDFVINYQGDSTILEVKAVNGNTKSAKTVMAHPDHYGKTKLIRIKDSNLSVSEHILTIPHYMAHLLFQWSAVLPVD